MNKTQPTGASVDDYIESRAKGDQADDCRALIAMFRKVSRKQPYMWGSSIVGFGTYRYTYESGRTGEAPLLGFAIRGREIVVYLDCEDEDKPLLKKLGKHRVSKACLYFKRLADLDTKVLEQLARNSIAATKRRYG